MQPPQVVSVVGNRIPPEKHSHGNGFVILLVVPKRKVKLAARHWLVLPAYSRGVSKENLFLIIDSRLKY